MKETLCIVILNIFVISFSSVLSQSDESKCGKIPKSFTNDFAIGPKNDPENNPVGHWPWMASIGNYSKDNKWQHQCGATLISNRHFLTAAHCVNLEWKIRIGHSNHAFVEDDANVEVLPIIDATIHPKYNGVSSYYDIAVLKTKKITITRAKSPVCLPTSPSFDVNKYENQFAELIGWGSLHIDGNANDMLKRVNIKVFPQKKCNVTHMNRPLTLNDTIQKKLPYLFPNHVLCAGSDVGGQGSCKGDSGGPLLFYDKDTDSWIQFALVQGVARDCGDIDYPEIYIRLEDPAIFSFIRSFLHSTKMTKVLVANEKNVIINLDEENPNLICDDMPDRIFPPYRAVGQLFMGKIPMICGGILNDCKCQAFQNGSWNIAPDLRECRSQAGSAILTNSDGKDIFFIYGGYGDKYGKILNTTETFDGAVWENDHTENLPESIFEPCIVKINSSTILSIGGTKFLFRQGFTGPDKIKNTYFYNTHINKWTPGPSLHSPRSDLLCGKLKWKNPDTSKIQDVIVAAAEIGITGKTIVELLFLNHDGNSEGEWVFGPELHESTYYATMIDYNNSVVIIGGGLGEDGRSHLFQLSSPNGPWIKMNQTLKYEKSRPVSFLVPDELVNCHNEK